MSSPQEIKIMPAKGITQRLQYWNKVRSDLFAALNAKPLGAAIMSDIPASIDAIRESAVQAHSSGQPITSNPYPIGSSAHTEWAAFWTLVDFETSYA